jgi:hypothetical protein
LSLGTIYVDLQANTGGFVSAMSKAAATAQAAAKDISREFTSLGRVASQTFGAFGDFNPVISKLSFALQTAGSAASGAMKSLSGLPGALGPIAALSAGAAVGLASVSAVMIGVAVNAAEDVARLRQLSLQTGMSVQSLSSLSFAAKQTGIEQETLVKSVQLLSTNMLKAAEAPKGAATAFSRLGLEIRNQNGDLKDSATFMGEVITKLSEMRDKTAAVGFARETMGRGGAAMLALDPDELQKWMDVSKKVNPISDDAADAALRFSQALGQIGESAKGARNSLMIDLLPMLDAVAQKMTAAASSQTSFFKDLTSVVAGATKWLVGEFDYWITAFEQSGLVIKHVAAGIINEFDAIIEAADRLMHFDFRGAAAALKEGVATQLAGGALFDADSKKIWQDHADFLKTMDSGLPKSKPSSLRTGGADTEPKEIGRTGRGIREHADEVADLVSKLQTQASAELAAAAATEKGTSAALLSKAAIEAETKISELRTHLLEQQKSLQSELGSANKEATGKGESRVPQIQAEIDANGKMLSELEANAPRIRELYAEISSADFAIKASKDLADFAEKTDAETAAANRMAAAYVKGGQAIVDASAGLKLAPFEKMRTDLGELITGLEKLGIAASTIDPLRTAFDQLGDGIARASAAEKASDLAKLSEEIGKQTNALRGEAAAYDITAAAALSSAAAQRQAAARAETVKFGADNPAATPAMLGQVYDNAIAKQKQQYDASILQEAAQLDLNKTYDDELNKLQRVREVLQGAGADTLAVDAKIDQLGTQMTQEWDKAALSVGDFSERFRAMVNEIEISGDKLGETVFSSLSKSIDGISGQLSHFIVTGKSSFLDFFNSIAEQILKAQIQWGFSQIFERAFGGPKPGTNPAGAIGPGGTAGTFPGKLGIGGAVAGAFGIKPPIAKGPLGTPGDPIYVAMSSAAAAVGNSTPSGRATPSVFGPSASGVPGPTGRPADPIYVAVASAASSAGPFGGSNIGSSSSSAGDGSQNSPFYSIIADSSGNPFGSENPLPLSPVPSGGFPSLTGLAAPDSGAGSAAGSSGTSQISSMLSSLSSMLQSAFSSLTSALSSIVSGIGSAMGSIGGAMGSAMGSIGSAVGSGFMSFLGIFGLARGGDVSAGQAYVVGEQRPEIFVPKENGRIVPSVGEFMRTAKFSGFSNSTAASAYGARFAAQSLSSSGAGDGSMNFFSGFERREYGGSVTAGMSYLTGERHAEVFAPNSSTSRGGAGGGAGAAHTTHFEMHVHGVTDADSFRRSQPQIQADMQQQMSIAHYRNRGGY